VSLAYAVVSTYPPTQCGLATFSQALLTALTSPTDHVAVIGLVDEPSPKLITPIVHEWVRSRPGGIALAAAAANHYDVAIIQHEFGIYGGRDGVDVLEFARALRVPAITVLHTVLDKPSPRQRMIVEELAQLSPIVVTMTHTGRSRLLEHYSVDADKVRVIPHGAVDSRIVLDRVSPLSVRQKRSATDRPVVLTWGLLGDGKGIEWGIEAMALLQDLSPRPCYHIVGETHPRVLERLGEQYRNGLQHKAKELRISDSIQFDARYLAGPELRAMVQAADVVLLPYDSVEQVTSGVLIEAVVAGKPVVSTAFPHAQELLEDGAGLLVPRQDPAAIAAALRRVLTDPQLANEMTSKATALAPGLLWPAVAQLYRDGATAAAGPDITLASA
jgi:glycosyltransferase involved in cell wall biosynthesis